MLKGNVRRGFRRDFGDLSGGSHYEPRTGLRPIHLVDRMADGAEHDQFGTLLVDNSRGDGESLFAVINSKRGRR